MENVEFYLAWFFYGAIFIALIFLIFKRIRDSRHERFDKRSN
ncbi:MAG TPA: hypothetical protein PLU49_07525 [Saprospiraceae bacterium]|nr:hypothetical protein [Saprospiraceae bacterium]